ncbi:NADH:ubiquinone oxidoreductase [Entomortierella beljakovae]|nr:NADH:ubiquinone oxidoreductase [Entomortierella beljakovae]
MSLKPDSFDNINDELEFYKLRAEELELELLETKYGLEEFQQSSKELEDELEKEIESTEKQYNEVKIRNEAMRQEVEEWKEKFYGSVKDSNNNINQLTRQLEGLRQQTEMFIKKERELEQNNDDLERNERATQWSLQEMERKYNVALERQAMLENEVSAKTALSEEVQRLKDELRDTNVELAVMKSNQSKPAKASSVSSLAGSASSVTAVGRKSPTHVTHGTSHGNYEAMPSIRARLAKSNGTHSQPRAESRVRSSATSASHGGQFPPQNPVLMVQEMVGRVKSLEARLVSCRSLVTPLLQPPPSYSTAVPSSQRMSPQNSQAGSRPGSRSGSLSGSRSGSPVKTAITSPKSSRRTSMMHSRPFNSSGMISS